MLETVCRSTRDIFNAIQTAREKSGMQWADFEIESGVTTNAVLKWGRGKSGCMTESVLKALKTVGLEMVIRPMRKEDKENADQ